MAEGEEQQTQEQNGQTPPEGQKEPEKKPVNMPQVDQRLKQMMEMDKKLSERERNLQSKEQQLQELQELKQLAQKDKMAAVKKLGLSPEEAAKLALSGGQEDPTSGLKEEISSIKNKLTEFEASTKRQQQQAALDEARQAIRTHIDGSEEYELVKAFDAHDAVFNEIASHFEKTGDVLSEDDAAKRVEEQLSGYVDKVLSTKKARTKLGTSEETPGAKKGKAGTLSNQEAGSRTSTQPKLDELPEEESIQILAKKLQQQGFGQT